MPGWLAHSIRQRMDDPGGVTRHAWGSCKRSLWRGAGAGIVLQPDGGSGFEALRAGNRFVTGSFGHIGSQGYFWTSTAVADRHAWRRGVQINREGIYRSVNDVTFGFSVRCISY
jgi:uncharacterized protein (TIGR02145 family)